MDCVPECPAKAAALALQPRPSGSWLQALRGQTVPLLSRTNWECGPTPPWLPPGRRGGGTGPQADPPVQV